MTRPKTVAIVPAAGCGRRLGLKIKKPFVLLHGKPLAAYALKTLNSSDAIDAIIIASERSAVARFYDLVRKYRLNKVTDVVIGGRTRFESVRNCLKAVKGRFSIVLIHDAARPFLDKRLIDESIRAAARYGASVVAMPESDTVKLADGCGFIVRTLDRTKVYRAETPQAFRYDIIRKAYRSKRPDATDDSSLVELLGRKARIVNGTSRNIKITTKEDLRLAEVLL